MADEVRVTVGGQERRAMLVQGGATGASADQLQGNVASDAVDSGNPVKVGGIYVTGPSPVASGDRIDAMYSRRGSASVMPAYTPIAGLDGRSNSNLGFGNTAADPVNELGTVLIPVQAGYLFNGTSWDREVKPNGVSRIVSAAATTNATVAKAAAGNLHKVVGYNAAAALRYLKIYNKATAPTVGTDTPILTIPLPGTAAFEIDFAALYFATGIGYAFTTAAADADTGALTLADITGFNLVYA